MQNIKIGQQIFKWEAEYDVWLKMSVCVVKNVVDCDQTLYLNFIDTKLDYCVPSNIRLWIEFAINKGWFREPMILEIVKVGKLTKVSQLKQSINDEKILVNHISKKISFTTDSLQKSKLAYELNHLENNINTDLPTIFKLLYLNLGNGSFGPDYGFFHLYDHQNSNKRNLLEAYNDIHDMHINDIDWELPDKYIPFLYWGTDIYSMIDCSVKESPVYIFDKNLKKENSKWQHCFWLHCDSLYTWLKKWIEDDLSGKALWMEMYKLKGLI